MDDNKIIVVVVILGMTAIVIMGLVAKIGLLESQVANPPGTRDNLRPGRKPPVANSTSPHTSLSYSGPKSTAQESAGVAKGEGDGSEELIASSDSASSSASSSSSAASSLKPYNPQASSGFSYAPAGNGTGGANVALDQVAEQAKKSLVRLTALDHQEELTTVATPVGAGGLMLAAAPYLAGAYEAWCTLPASKSKTPATKRCVAWSPHVNLAVLRLDDAQEPLTPLPLASALPEKNDKLAMFYDSGQLDLGRSNVTVQGLLNTSDVQKKLQRDFPQLGDMVWIETSGAFPPQVEGAPLLNSQGELAGVVVLDLQPPTPPGGTPIVYGSFQSGSTSAGMTTRRVYAVAAPALKELVEQSTNSSEELLFTLAAPHYSSRGASAPVSWSIQLPSGESLTSKAFEPVKVVDRTGTLNYATGRRCAALTLSDRKTLDGPVSIHDKEGREILRWNFLQGRRHGSMAAFGADGSCVLAAQFQRNERHGYCLYFKRGAPWLVQEYQDGELGAQHLVKQGAVFYTIAAGKSLETVDAILRQYGDWADWDARLTAVAVQLERWAKEAERTQRQARTGRTNLDSLAAAQQEAVVAIEEFRKLIP